MKIIFSRKGFDSGSGGAPSPIINGLLVSLPIPTSRRSITTYADIGLGDQVEIATKGLISANNLCHYDPMFENGRCAFGQTAAAQTHLFNNNIGIGDIFLFFGLFSNLDRQDPHHRLFGFLKVDSIIELGSHPTAKDQPSGFSIRHPHTIGEWNGNNTLYLGTGLKAKGAPESLRLSRPGGKISSWRVPHWLSEIGMTYHRNPERWIKPDGLIVASRGQEFICDISGRPDAMVWLEKILSLMKGISPDGVTLFE